MATLFGYATSLMSLQMELVVLSIRYSRRLKLPRKEQARVFNLIQSMLLRWTCPPTRSSSKVGPLGRPALWHKLSLSESLLLIWTKLIALQESITGLQQRHVSPANHLALHARIVQPLAHGARMIRWSSMMEYLLVVSVKVPTALLARSRIHI